ncbi:fam-a protein [Plasmodium chabaudi adami]|uniref:Fam-a protein n=1 Tax=Plasmodium chabaudi adami TaxID=5826 RepID=A0A1C6WSU1_PLACE|nr:fam-a protein [Plasmodium chabaudi adami]
MNKFYIQIVFFLLSVSVYLNNKTLATEPASGKTTKTKSKNSYATSEEIYEKNKELLCTKPEEIKNAEKLMNEATIHLIDHAKSSYKRVGESSLYKAFLYKKKHDDNTDVVKLIYRKNDPNKYNKIIGKLWDPDIKNLVDPRSTKRKIARVYNPNLVIIQQRYKDSIFGRWKYFYALAKKVQISEDTTVIAMTSANINDDHPSDKEYKNTIIENANLFTTEIDSEEDIKKGKLTKTFLNIGGYIIKKNEEYVLITYVGSINGHTIF